MNSVGIDASKGKSTVAVIHPGGEVSMPPFEVNHTISELGALTERLRSLDGEIHKDFLCQTVSFAFAFFSISIFTFLFSLFYHIPPLLVTHFILHSRIDTSGP